MGDLRTMLAEVGKVYEGQLAAKDQTIDTQAGALAAQQETIAEPRRQRDEDRERERGVVEELRRRAEVAEAEADALRLRLGEVDVPPVVVVAGQEAPEGQDAPATTSRSQQGVRGFWRRLRRAWRGR